MEKTYIVADIHGLRDPVVRDAAQRSRQTVDISSSLTTVGVDIAFFAGVVLRVTDKEDGFDGVKSITSKLGHGIGRSRSALGVSLEHKACIGRRRDCRLDFVDDVVGADCRDLREVGWVDGVVDAAAGFLALDVGVHSAEA